MKAAGKTPLTHKREFFCVTCGTKEPMDAPTMKEHLRTVHRFENLKGKKTTVLCLDGDFYSNTFDWIFGNGPQEVRVTEIASGPKR